MSRGFEWFEPLAAEVARAVPRGLGPVTGPQPRDSRLRPGGCRSRREGLPRQHPERLSPLPAPEICTGVSRGRDRQEAKSTLFLNFRV